MFQFATEFKLDHPQDWLVSLSVTKDLAKIAKCWNQGFDDFCETNSSMLEAKSVNDPKIKVVPYTKYYNFALVTTSMQGL